MARVIQEHIKRPLAEELLFGKLTAGGHVRVEMAAGGEALLLTVEPATRELEHLPDVASADAASGRKSTRRPSTDADRRRPGGKDSTDDRELAEQSDRDGEL
jgi:hypothetical protein